MNYLDKAEDQLRDLLQNETSEDKIVIFFTKKLLESFQNGLAAIKKSKSPYASQSKNTKRAAQK